MLRRISRTTRPVSAGFVEVYNRWKEKADADPQRAEDNPFFYDATRADKRFLISTNA